MATEQKDFKVKKGIIIGGNISSTSGGFFYDNTANSLALGGSVVALQSAVDTVQSNVSANATDILTGVANTYNTYTSLKANVDLVQDNVVIGVANTHNTYVTLSGLIDDVQDNVNAGSTSIDTVQDNVATASARLDSLKYFRRITANGVNVDAGANADSLTLTAGDGITLIGDAGSKSVAIHVDGSTDVNTVQDNVAATNANVNLVQDNVAAITDGTTAFTGNVTMNQNLTVDGDLVVGGTQTTIGSVDTTIQDRTLILSNGAAAASFDSGVLISRGSDANVFVGWDESADQIALAFTQDEGSNVVTDFNFSGYADLRVNNLIVDGTVDGVDVADLSTRFGTVEADLPTISSNTVTNANRLDSLVYYNTIQVSGQSDVAASANADVLTFVAGTGITLTTAADEITVASTIGADVDLVQDNVSAVVNGLTAANTNISTNTTNIDTVNANLDAVIDGTTSFTGDSTFLGSVSTPVTKLNTQLHVTSNVKSSVGTADTEIFNFPGTVYRAAELTFLTQDISNSEYQINKMLIVHDGTDVHFTEYGAVHTGTNELSTFNVTIDGSDIISVRSSGGSANKKISVASHNLIQ
jgi:hypothetical protein